jgi:type IV fimbrial biogenesis protein FimT
MKGSYAFRPSTAWHDRNSPPITLRKASVQKAGVPRYFDVPRDSSYYQVTQARVGTESAKVAGDTGLMISVIRICCDHLVSQSGTPRVRQMFMRSLEINAGRGHRASGFSLIEMLIVVALVIVLASISFISFVPVMKRQRVTNAYNTTLSAMRQARDNAVSQRTSYSVTFSTTVQPNTITVSPTLTGGFQGSQNTVVYQLPTDVTFLAQSGLPATAPDGYGTGLAAVDFGYTAHATGGATTIYFCPDGSGQDDSTGNCAGNWDGGVVYIARSGDLLSTRAITLWGGTGRIRGWRIYSNGAGGYQWLRQ